MAGKLVNKISKHSTKYIFVYNSENHAPPYGGVTGERVQICSLISMVQGQFSHHLNIHLSYALSCNASISHTCYTIVVSPIAELFRTYNDNVKVQ